MSMQTKWNLRQFVLELLSYLLCFTAAIAVMLAVRGYQLGELGLAMYPNIQWPQQIHINTVLNVFWQESAWPLLQWLPVALVADAFLRRHVYQLRE